MNKKILLILTFFVIAVLTIKVFRFEKKEYIILRLQSEYSTEKEDDFKKLLSMEHKDFRNVDLSLCLFYKEHWKSLDLSHSNLGHIYLAHAAMQDCNLSNSDLSSAYMYGAFLENVNLQNVNLKEAYLQKAHFCNVTGLTVKQISECSNLEGIRGLSKDFMLKIKKKKPELMEWWKEAN